MSNPLAYAEALRRIWFFIDDHERTCGKGLVASTDVVPRVIRVDCMACGATIQERVTL